MTDSNATAENSNEPTFNIERVYLKDLSFETPGTPDVFRDQWEPNMDVQLQHQSKALGDDVYEVVLTTTITVTAEEKTVFLIEAHYAGIFSITNFPTEQRDALLGSVCPSILFPYVRSIVSETVTHGSFPQLLLAPVNFEALYMEQMKQAEANAANSGAESTETAH